jgi:lipoteichoic acid synthase
MVLFCLANIAKYTYFRYLISSSGMNLNNFLFVASTSTALLGLVWFGLAGLKRPWALMACYLVQTAYLFVNLTYFGYYSTVLTISTARILLGDVLATFRNSGIPFAWNYQGFLFLDLPLLLGILISFGALKTRLGGAPKRPVRIVLALDLVFLFSAGVFRAIDEPPLRVIHRSRSFHKVVNAYGPLFFQVSNYFVNERNYDGMMESLQPSGAVLGSSGRAGPPMNLVIVQIEALGSDIPFTEVSDGPLMPYLRSFAGVSAYYPFMLAMIKGGGTSDAEFTILNSTEALGGFPAMNLPLKYDNSLAKAFKSAGYETIAYHGNHPGFYSRGQAFKNMGFDRFESQDTMGLSTIGWGVPDHALFDHVLKAFELGGKPAFRYLITLSSHGPYNIVPLYFHAPFERGQLSDFEYRYFESMRYVDTQLKKLIEHLRLRGDTCIIIFGDHPDMYVPSDETSHARAKFNSEGINLRFTPLYIYLPGRKAKAYPGIAASFLDVAPTSLEASGIAYSIRSKGENLVGPKEPSSKIEFNDRLFDRKELFISLSRVVGENTTRSVR